MIDAELGKKLTCPDCTVKFYDLVKNPATCPKCGAIFTADPVLPSKEDRPPETKEEAEAGKEAEEITVIDPKEVVETEVVSLEDIDIDDEDDVTEDDEVAAIKDVDLGDGDKDDALVSEDDDKFLDIDDDETSVVPDIVGGKATGDDE